MPGGRPTKWSKELEAKAWDYIDTWNSEYGHTIPSIQGLAVELKIGTSTIYDWAEVEGKQQQGQFSDILPAIMDKQHLVLIDKGLLKDFDSGITKLVLGKHGYHAKEDREISGPGGKPIEKDITITFVDFHEDDPKVEDVDGDIEAKS